MDPETTSLRRFDPLLLVIVAIAAAGGALIVAQARNWAVMTDELLYTSMARSIAHTIIPLPQIRGDYVPVNQVLYPALIAPIVGALSMPVAYSWIAALNGVIFATSAIPAYMLASFVTQSRAASRWVAVCTVTVPWLAFASKALPDALAYVAVLWCIYAIARTAGDSKQRTKGDLLALLALTLTYLVRNQFLFLVGVWVAAIVLVRTSETIANKTAKDLPRDLLALLKDRPIPFVSFVAIVLLIKIQPVWILGLYSVTTTSTEGGAAPPGVLGAIFNHASVIGLGVAGIPLVLGLPWLVTALTRVKERNENAGAIVILLSSAAILYVGASFDVRFTEADRVIERYVFYLAPLMFVALAGLLTRPPRSVIAYAVPAVIGLFILNASHPYGLDTRLTLEINHVFSPMQVALIQYQKVADSIGMSIFMLYAVVIFLAAAITWWLLTSGRQRVALNGVFALTAAILIASTLYAVPKIVDVQNELIDNLFGARDNGQKAWLEGDGPVSLAFSPVADPTDHSRHRDAERLSNWWDLVFWNGNISAVYLPYRATARSSSPIPGTGSQLLDWETGRLARKPNDDSDKLVQADHDPNFAPQFTGEPLGGEGWVLRETGRDAKAAWATRGLTARGWVPPSGATLRVYAAKDAQRAERVGVEVWMTSPRRDGDLGGFSIEGARNLRASPGTDYTLFTWTAVVPAGGHADFKLVRGDKPAHVELINAISLRSLREHPVNLPRLSGP